MCPDLFCEWAQTKPKKTPTWFALDDDRPLFAFAGIWTAWTGTRGTMKNPIEGEHQVYGFLTTDAYGVVGPIHPKATPVLLTSPEEHDVWLRAPWSEAFAGRHLDGRTGGRPGAGPRTTGGRVSAELLLHPWRNRVQSSRCIEGPGNSGVGSLEGGDDRLERLQGRREVAVFDGECNDPRLEVGGAQRRRQAGDSGCDERGVK